MLLSGGELLKPILDESIINNITFSSLFGIATCATFRV